MEPHNERRRDLAGLALLSLALFMALSLIPVRAFGGAAVEMFPSGNLVGPLGDGFARSGLWLLGIGLPILVTALAVVGVGMFGWLAPARTRRVGLLLLGTAVLAPTFVAVVRSRGWVGGAGDVPPGAGWVGGTLGLPLAALLSWLGAALLLLVLFTGLSILTVGWNPARSVVRGGAAVLRRLGRRREPEAAPSPWEALTPEPVAIDAAEPELEQPKPKRSLRRRAKKAPEAPHELADPGRPESGDLAPITLLSEAPARDRELSDRELDRLGETLIDTLSTFKVDSSIGGRTTGPVVTQFEVVPAPGVKVNRIANLDADIALALKAPSVRIVAPIPGKGAVGVEVPNPEPEIVSLREILGAPAFQQSKGQLPLALGKDLNGRAYVTDLARCPHLLIAGATGSGKSVCINTIITSLIYRHSPQSLRLLMVDPKMVELSMYSDLPHLRHPVVTDPGDAAMVLKWAVLEMERRYELLSSNACRSIHEFNRRVAQERPLKSLEPHGPEGDPDRWKYEDGALPYVVVIIDELADLMMAVQAEIEKPLAQLAQKARAIGIHLIVATQRPSVNVITGLIKANFPSRIAFRVSSKVDSRTILDANGADALLGNGDMLFMPPSQSDPVRIQGAFLSTEDTERLMDWYRERADGGATATADEADILEVVREHDEAQSGDRVDEVLEDWDPLFRQAAEVVIQHQQGSTSLLQRRLRIGYGRAARIVDQLHHAGVLGPPNGSQPRDVLVGMDALDLIMAAADSDGPSEGA